MTDALKLWYRFGDYSGLSGRGIEAGGEGVRVSGSGPTSRLRLSGVDAPGQALPVLPGEEQYQVLRLHMDQPQSANYSYGLL